ARQLAEFGVGSGVVWDSDAGGEYAECLNKAAMLSSVSPPFRLLETFGWRPGNGFVRLDAHLARLRRSAAYFGFRRPDEHELRRRLAETVCGRTDDTRVRLLVDSEGAADIELSPLVPLPTPIRVALGE